MSGAADAPIILMYHRIADPPFDPWGLCVTPERFAAQLEELKARRTVIPLDELVQRLESGTVPPRATALTFDDGYADNAIAAKPLLEQAGVPATMFLTTGFVGSDRPFWWDELSGRVLGTREAAVFELDIGGERFAGSWGAQDRPPPALRHWRTAYGARNARQRAYLELWERLQRLDTDSREQAMADLRAVLLASEQMPALPMTEAMARDLPSALVTVAGHGRAHVPLTSLSAKRMEEEIAGGRADIAALTRLPPPLGFAYPHGSWNPAARQTVIDAGYGWAVTTRPSVVDPRRFDRYTLPRMEAGDWNPPRLMAAMAGLGVD